MRHLGDEDNNDDDNDDDDDDDGDDDDDDDDDDDNNDDDNKDDIEDVKAELKWKPIYVKIEDSRGYRFIGKLSKILEFLEVRALECSINFSPHYLEQRAIRDKSV